MDLYQQGKYSMTHSARMALFASAGTATILAFAFRLRELSFAAQPPLAASINIIGVFLGLTFAANALVRFRGTRDQTALVLAVGFSLSAVIELGITVDLFSHLSNATSWFQRIGVSWLQSRMLLAECLILAISCEQRLPRTRPSGRNIIVGLTVAGTATYFCSVLCFGFTGSPNIRANALVPRPWDLLPAVLFLLAAIGFQRRLRQASSALDHALAAAAWMNFACHLFLVESSRILDASSAIAQALRVSSYAVVLGGSLIDNARIFAQVQRLAISDPLTGLANYRHLIDILESEVERSGRTGREFAIILLDLDGLKRINDQHGHVVGSRALCRLADTLRIGSRSIDTPARYGGDEFAIVLPETGEHAALSVADRIRRSLSFQAEAPALSVSTGVAVYPANGHTIERLLASADEALYGMKSARRSNARFAEQF